MLIINLLNGNLPPLLRNGGRIQVFQNFIVSSTATLVNIFALVSLSSGIPSSVPTPVLARSIGIPIASPTTSYYGLGGPRVPKQIGMPMQQQASSTDHLSSGTHHHHGFHHDHHHHHDHGHHGDGKYFMYAHNPGYDEYEYGYRRGNDHHFQERYEKYGPAWNFKTKVKWGDKYGGYGEHYWDYNHAGSGHDDYGHGGGGGGGGGGGVGGGGGGGGHGHGHGWGHGYSEPVPTYEHNPSVASSHPHKSVAIIHKRQSEADLQGKVRKTGGFKRISFKKETQIMSPSPSIVPVMTDDKGDNRTVEETEGMIAKLFMDNSESSKITEKDNNREKANDGKWLRRIPQYY